MSSHCKLCGKRLTLAHVLNHCQVAFNLRRYNARHDAVLEVIDQFVRENCPPDVEAITNLPGSVYIFPAHIVPTIGACRAVWVPGQDLAMPHLIAQLRKRILSLHPLYAIYIRLCVRKHDRPRVFASAPRDMSMHDSK